MGRLIELEQELLRQSADSARLSQLNVMIAGGDSQAAMIASGHERIWEAWRVRRNGVKVARLERRNGLVHRSVSRGACRVADDSRTNRGPNPHN